MFVLSMCVHVTLLHACKWADNFAMSFVEMQDKMTQTIQIVVLYELDAILA